MTVIKVLEDGPIARYLPTSGLMLVSSSVKFFHDALTLERTDTHQYQYILACIHETVHHLQALSSAFLWMSALKTIDAAVRVLLPSSPDMRIEGMAEIARLERAWQIRAYGVSVADLCEGTAVLESYKACVIAPSLSGYYEYRDQDFRGKGNSIYRRTFDIMAEVLGPEVAFDLLPVVTLVALQGDIPGRSFEMILGNNSVKWDGLIGRPAREVVKALGYTLGLPSDPSAMDLSELHPAQRHRVFYPALSHMKIEYPGDLFEAMARPSTALRLPVNAAFLPPLIIGAHILGEPKALGFGVGLNTRIREDITSLSALIGAAQQIVISPLKRAPWLPCPHLVCPSHSKGVCSGVVPAPSRPEVCYFRNTIRDTGRDLHEIVAECEPAVGPEIQKILSSDELNTVFPGVEVVQDVDPHNTFAERFDSKHKLDPEDNDAVLSIPCRKCGNTWGGRASLRSIQEGVRTSCPSCGEPLSIDLDNAVVINFD